MDFPYNYKMIINMNKCIVLNFAALVIFVNSKTNDLYRPYEDCMYSLLDGDFYDTNCGFDAFVHAYHNLTINFMRRSNRETLNDYYNELYTSATVDYQEGMLLSPICWCHKIYENDPICLHAMIEGKYIVVVQNEMRELTSFEALKHSYFNIKMTRLKNDIMKEYYNYLLKTYQEILLIKPLRNPVEFCMKVPASRLPSNYAGFFSGNFNFGKEINAQNQEGTQYAREGCSRELDLAVDYDGHFIDLNQPYKDEEKLTTEHFSDTNSGLSAFEYAYYYLTTQYTTRNNRDTLHDYYFELFESAIKDYEEYMLLSPRNWCAEKYFNNPYCLYQLMMGGYKNRLHGMDLELSSFEALKHSYLSTNKFCIHLKNHITKLYYQYLFYEFQKILHTKTLRNPVEFYSTSNENMNVQNQEENRNSEEECSRAFQVALDNDGYEIDLNFPPSDY